MADFTVAVDYEAVSLFGAELGEEVSQIIGPVLKKSAQGRAPVRSGNLLKSIEWRHVPGPSGGQTQLSAIWYDLFLERPAKQMHMARRTLMDALEHDIPPLI